MTGDEQRRRFVFLGGGNMAGAIIEGAVRSGAVAAEDVVVIDRSSAALEKFAGLGVRGTTEAREGLAEAGEDAVVVLAVKPQGVEEAGAGLQEAGWHGTRTAVSILAGTTLARLQGVLGADAALVRAMPNTPASIGMGVTALCFEDRVPEGDVRAVRALFGGVGEVVQLEEALFDAFTALAGSGPAYVFLLAEALAAGAERLGLEPKDADRVTREMLMGAAALLARSDRSAAELRRAVTSPGGTTAAALDVFEDGGLRELVGRAIEAARDRGRELSEDG